MGERGDIRPEEFGALTKMVEAFCPRLSRSQIFTWVDMLLDEVRERERWEAQGASTDPGAEPRPGFAVPGEERRSFGAAQPAP